MADFEIKEADRKVMKEFETTDEFNVADDAEEGNKLKNAPCCKDCVTHP
jgi:hypothetical protein